MKLFEVTDNMDGNLVTVNAERILCIYKSYNDKASIYFGHQSRICVAESYDNVVHLWTEALKRKE